MKLASALGKRKAEINLVPLLDSIFILIFFFMFALTTMVKKNGISVALPQAGSGKKVEEKITLSIKENGSLYWNEIPFPKEELSQRLQGFKKQFPDTSLIIQGDRNTPFENIVTILDMAEEIQLRRVTIETKSK